MAAGELLSHAKLFGPEQASLVTVPPSRGHHGAKPRRWLPGVQAPLLFVLWTTACHDLRMLLVSASASD